MPNIANMTVKKADGITDIIYSYVSGAAAAAAAVWRSAVGSAPAHKAEYRVKGSSNQSGTVRRIEGIYVYPQTVTGTDGTVTVANRGTISFQAVVPQAMPQTEINEMAHQGLNLIGHSLTKSSVTEGFAPS